MVFWEIPSIQNGWSEEYHHEMKNKRERGVHWRYEQQWRHEPSKEERLLVEENGSIWRRQQERDAADLMGFSFWKSFYYAFVSRSRGGFGPGYIVYTWATNNFVHFIIC